MGWLDGKVAIVTGAARGSGALIAKRLVADGAQVVLSDILDDLGKPLAEELGDAARYQHLELSPLVHQRAQRVRIRCMSVLCNFT